MSKSQLQSNNTRLASLIDELKGKAAGGGSGGAVETCTVTAVGPAYGIANFALYLSYVNGMYTPIYEQMYFEDSSVNCEFTVVKGSAVFLVGTGSNLGDISMSGDCEIVLSTYDTTSRLYIVGIRTDGDATLFII